MQTIISQSGALSAGRTTSRALVEACLARIADPAGEGGRVFIKVFADSARAAADAADLLRQAGRAPSPYAGIPISLKDLFDVAGEPTPAGSRFLAEAAPAAAHAPVVARLLGAGFIPVGRTNMTEFAFSGLGINPHHGTPRSPWDRATGHIPGGSSSGAAVSVSDGMASGALGTDTGGSCRIPAALCGITGFKPTARRVPNAGVLPLSPSLDSVGPLAPSVACCAILDAVLSGAAPVAEAALPLRGLRVLVPTNVVMDGVEPAVAAAFDRALACLSANGAVIVQAPFPVLDQLGSANRRGGFAVTEAFAWHRQHLPTHASAYDPRILSRITRGAGLLAADYIDLLAARARLIHAADAASAAFDVLAMPTVPLLAPTLAELEDEATYNRVNQLLLRNPAIANFLDRCAISLPCHRAGDPPVGLTLMGETLSDRRLFAIAAGVEAALAQA